MLAPQSRNGAISVADQPPKARRSSPTSSAFFGVLTCLTVGSVVAFLYFARDVIVPITLAILLSFLLAPVVRRLLRWHFPRVAAVTLTVVIAFVALLGFAAIVVQEISSLAQQLPEYRSNLETKIRSLPAIVPGGGVFGRLASMAEQLGRELKQTETAASMPTGDRSAIGAPSDQLAKPVPVEIQRPEFGSLLIVQSIVGPLLQPLAMAGLVIVFVIM